MKFAIAYLNFSVVIELMEVINILSLFLKDSEFKFYISAL